VEDTEVMISDCYRAIRKLQKAEKKSDYQVEMLLEVLD
jgi:hypothetical protein